MLLDKQKKKKVKPNRETRYRLTQQACYCGGRMHIGLTSDILTHHPDAPRRCAVCSSPFHEWKKSYVMTNCSLGKNVVHPDGSSTCLACWVTTGPWLKEIKEHYGLHHKYILKFKKKQYRKIVDKKMAELDLLEAVCHP